MLLVILLNPHKYLRKLEIWWQKVLHMLEWEKRGGTTN